MKEQILKAGLIRWYEDETLYEVKKEFKFRGQQLELRVLKNEITCFGERVVDMYNGFYRGYTAIVDPNTGEVLHSITNHPSSIDLINDGGSLNEGATIGLEMGIAIFED